MINKTQEEITKKWPKEWEAPTVSIRCTAYNHELYIAQALDGFLMQETNFPFEIVIHDDASTDKTQEIIREYEKRFPKIIAPIYQTENQYSKHDGKLTKLINNACKGRYVAFCEGDDYWNDKNKLQIQIDFLESNPDYFMHFHNTEIENEIGVSYGLDNEKIEDRDYTATEIFNDWIIPTASICCRREVLFMPIKHPERILNGDIFLAEAAAHLGKIRGNPKRMSVYRIHNSGVTYDANRSKARLLSYPAHFKTIAENFPKIEKKAIKKKLFSSYFNIHKEIDKNAIWLIKAFLTSPSLFFKRFLNKIIRVIKKNKS